MKDKHLHGTALAGEKNIHAKLSNRMVLKIFSDPRPTKIIAAEYGCLAVTVNNIKSGKQWSYVTGKKFVGAPRVSANGSACALTEDQVLAIVKDGRNNTQIARDYPVSRLAISLIKRGERWGWLTGIRKAA